MFKHLSFHPKSLQSCLTLRNPMHLSPQGSSVHGFLQARILEWVAIPFSKNLPNLGIKPLSVRSPALAGFFFFFFFFTTSATWEAQDIKKLSKYLGWLRSRPSAELLVMPPVYNQVPKGATTSATIKKLPAQSEISCNMG